MALDNVADILKVGSPVTTCKLLLMQGMLSRPAYAPVLGSLLRPFVSQQKVAITYRCHHRMMNCFIRISELESDFMSVRELAVNDVYQLDPEFHPDLVVDGGGNIGMFTLRAAASLQAAGDTATKLILCEPVPANVDRIREHLAVNHIDATIMQVCLGGTSRTIPFYVREANQGSFDSSKPYTSALEIPVFTMRQVIAESTAQRILIKLDIEGTEVETLSAFIPSETRAVYIVGELHEFAINAPLMQKLFHSNGWTLEFVNIADDLCTFKACSPAALPLLPSLNRRRNTPEVVSPHPGVSVP